MYCACVCIPMSEFVHFAIRSFSDLKLNIDALLTTKEIAENHELIHWHTEEHAQRVTFKEPNHNLTKVNVGV